MRKTQIEGPPFDCYPRMSNQYIWINSYPIWSSTCGTHCDDQSGLKTWNTACQSVHRSFAVFCHVPKESYQLSR